MAKPQKTDKSDHYKGHYNHIPLELALSKNDTTIRHIENPDPMLARMRETERAKAAAGKAPACPHPISAIGQFYDDSSDKGRNARPTNLFECTLCHSLLALFDFWQQPASDG